MTRSGTIRGTGHGAKALLVLGGAAVAVAAATIPAAAAPTAHAARQTPSAVARTRPANGHAFSRAQVAAATRARAAYSASHLHANVAGAGFSPIVPGAGESPRLLDTRTGGVATNPGAAGPVVGLVEAMVTSDVSTGATVELTVTATSPSGTGYVTAYPEADAGVSTAAPLASNLNYGSGRNYSSTVLVTVPASGIVDLNLVGAPTNVIIDEDGYFDASQLTHPDSGTDPVRVGDSRTPTTTGGFTTGLQHGVVTLSLGTAYAGRPVALNVTATGATGGGYVSAYGGTTPPATSTLDFYQGSTVSNLAFVTPSSTGAVSFDVVGASTNLVVDLDAAGPAGTQLTTTSARLADSRVPTGLPKGPLAGPHTLTLSALQAPSGTDGVILNVTAVGAAGSGYTVTYPGTAVPATSQLQFVASLAGAQTIVVPVGSPPSFTISSFGSPTQLVVDLEGTTNNLG